LLYGAQQTSDDTGSAGRAETAGARAASKPHRSKKAKQASVTADPLAAMEAAFTGVTDFPATGRHDVRNVSDGEESGSASEPDGGEDSAGEAEDADDAQDAEDTDDDEEDEEEEVDALHNLDEAAQMVGDASDEDASDASSDEDDSNDNNNGDEDEEDEEALSAEDEEVVAEDKSDAAFMEWVVGHPFLFCCVPAVPSASVVTDRTD
jgi:hypothetical protein